MRAAKFPGLLLTAFAGLAALFGLAGAGRAGSTGAGPSASPIGAVETLTLASTTSTLDSGFFDVFIPAFEKKFSCKVKIIAVGTGQAMRLGRDGNADVLLVHDRESELKFVADGFGIERLDVMHNDFFVVGPKADPSGVGGKGARDAFRALAAGPGIFVSRGDDSGTNKKELRMWAAIGGKPAKDQYIESGSGMEAALRMANEKLAYTIVDRATWLAHRKEIDALVALVDGDPELFNPYSVIVVSPAKFPGLNSKLARAFAGFIRGPEGQAIIRDFGKDKFGAPLFFPDVIR
jgi:tungstate transport system substrate-binding protein